MSTKIYANARFGFREDTLENWMANNPVLEKGEPAVVRDGENGEWLKIGDGVTEFNRLPWKKGPKGDKGDAGATAKTEIAQIKNNSTVLLQDNTEYYSDEPITALTVTYPTDIFISSLYFTLADEGEITVTLPDTTKYIGGAPTFANGETWELNIKNGVVVGGRVE